tara:strand:- start:3 stop:692 length:690 start_codon:yes stop_codon:yes gene_type:complete
MKGSVTNIKAENRELSGSSASKKLRRSGKIPGVVYGSDDNPTLIQLDHNHISLALDVESFHSSILNLDVEGAVEKVLLRDYQMHPFRRQVTHIDFQRVDEKKRIHTNVPLHFIGEEDSPAVKMAGGTISHILNDVEITCLPKDLPSFIEIDLTDLEIGNSLHISQLSFPKGVEPILHGQDDPVVVTAIKPKGGASDDEEESSADEIASTSDEVDNSNSTGSGESEAGAS